MDPYDLIVIDTDRPGGDVGGQTVVCVEAVSLTVRNKCLWTIDNVIRSLVGLPNKVSVGLAN
jgi:hypothetical protein